MACSQPTLKKGTTAMSEDKKDHTDDKTTKPNVRDLEAKKDVKGGGTFKPASPGQGGSSTQPVPGQGS
jgi:hypothetical protein